MGMGSMAFEVDVGALVRVLSSSLYTDRRVFVRELVANARDALLRRLGDQVPGDGEIHVDVDNAARSLVVRDNGLGMDEGDIRSALSTLAGSSTRLLRDEGGAESIWSEALSGYFGLGFLSAFIVSETVEVTTRRRGSPGPALLWKCDDLASSRYTLEETAWEGEGTEVRLRLKPEYDDLLYPPILQRLVTRYSDLVEFPIYVSGFARPVNRRRAPWEQQPPAEEDLLRYLADRGLTGETPPVLLLPVRDPSGLQGCLFLPAEPQEGSGIELHVRRLFVGESRKYLPSSLPFLRGSVECPWAPLTLSREDVVEGEELTALRLALRQAFLGGLRQLERARPADFGRVLTAYERALKLAAVEDEQVLDGLGEVFRLPVGTRGSPMALGALLAADPEKPIHYLTDFGTQGHYLPLLESHGVRVAVAADRLDEAVLVRLAQLRRRQTVRVDAVAPPSEEAAAPAQWLAVEALFARADPGIETRAVTLNTPVPALLVSSASKQVREALRELRARPGAQSQRMAETVEAWLAQAPREREQLLLNAGHPLLAALRAGLETGLDFGLLTAAARAILACARLYGGHLEPGDRLAAYAAQADAYRLLLENLCAGLKPSGAQAARPRTDQRGEDG